MSECRKLPAIIADLLCGGMFIFTATVLVSNNASASTCFLPDGTDCGIEEWKAPDDNSVDCHERYRPHSNCVKCPNGWYVCGECETGYVVDERGGCKECKSNEVILDGKCVPDPCDVYTYESIPENYTCNQCDKDYSKNFGKYHCWEDPSNWCVRNGYTLTRSEIEACQEKGFTPGLRCLYLQEFHDYWKPCTCDKHVINDECKADPCSGGVTDTSSYDGHCYICQEKCQELNEGAKHYLCDVKVPVDRGYKLNENQCVINTCAEGSGTDITCDTVGYSKVLTGEYSGDKPCYKCDKTDCTGRTGNSTEDKSDKGYTCSLVCQSEDKSYYDCKCVGDIPASLVSRLDSNCFRCTEKCGQDDPHELIQYSECVYKPKNGYTGGIKMELLIRDHGTRNVSELLQYEDLSTFTDSDFCIGVAACSDSNWTQGKELPDDECYEKKQDLTNGDICYAKKEPYCEDGYTLDKPTSGCWKTKTQKCGTKTCYQSYTHTCTGNQKVKGSGTNCSCYTPGSGGGGSVGIPCDGYNLTEKPKDCSYETCTYDDGMKRVDKYKIIKCKDNNNNNNDNSNSNDYNYDVYCYGDDGPDWPFPYDTGGGSGSSDPNTCGGKGPCQSPNSICCVWSVTADSSCANAGTRTYYKCAATVGECPDSKTASCHVGTPVAD